MYNAKVENGGPIGRGLSWSHSEACRSANALSWRLILLACLWISLILPASAKEEENTIPRNAIYHYFDHEGNRQLGSFIPPEYVRYGYTVKDVFGREILSVDKALTGAALKKRKAEREQARIKKEKDQRDEMLLRTFSSATDAMRARDRKLATLDVIIEVTRSNILTRQQEYDDLQEKAAGMERSNEEVPEEIIERLVLLQEEIGGALEFVNKKQDEKKVWRKSYEKDIQRLRELQDLKNNEPSSVSLK